MTKRRPGDFGSKDYVCKGCNGCTSERPDTHPECIRCDCSVTFPLAKCPCPVDSKPCETCAAAVKAEPEQTVAALNDELADAMAKVVNLESRIETNEQQIRARQLNLAKLHPELKAAKEKAQSLAAALAKRLTP